ncbi:MAG: four-helix bundle copper-binding protein [Bacteriovoracaceae bacterium]
MNLENVSSHILKSNKFSRCITDCLQSFETCTSSIQHCLQEGGVHADPRHMSLMIECARICQLSAEFMLSGSPYAQDLCNVCSLICEECAISCDSIDPRDGILKECAEFCRKCSVSCRNMGA